MWTTKLRIIFIILVLLGALNWGSVAILNKNFVEELNDITFKNKKFVNGVYILIALSAIFLAIRRDTYLPTLGNAIVPTKGFQSYYTYNDNSIKINAGNATKVIYWAANPNGNVVNDSQSAYNSYENSGIVPVDPDGTATLFFKCPGQYKLNAGLWTLPKHINYRLVLNDSTLSDVYKINVNC
jgi:uncharacterized membrane protein YuzA (DUF378 family)